MRALSHLPGTMNRYLDRRGECRVDDLQAELDRRGLRDHRGRCCHRLCDLDRWPGIPADPEAEARIAREALAGFRAARAAEAADSSQVWARPNAWDTPSKPTSVTLIQEPDGRYYVSFVVEVAPVEPPPAKPVRLAPTAK